MPYCVNCGVELETSCKSCPLCDTEVIIPKKLKKDIVEAPSYSPNFEIPKSTSKKVSGICAFDTYDASQRSFSDS